MGFKPTPGNISDLSVQIGWINTNVSLSGTTLTFGVGTGIALAVTDPGCVIKIMGAGPGGKPLWTTVATAISTTAGTTTNPATAPVTGKQAVIYRPISLYGHLLIGTVEGQSSIRNLPTFNFTVHSPTGTFAPAAGQPILVTHASMGDVFGGYIEQVETSNTPGNIPIDSKCECVAWDKKLGKRLLSMAAVVNPSTVEVFTLDGQRTYNMNAVPSLVTDVSLVGLGSIAGNVVTIIWGAEFYQGIGTHMIIGGITYSITGFPTTTTATLSSSPPSSSGITYLIPQTFNTIGADTVSQWFWDATTNVLTQGFQSSNVLAETLVPHGGVFNMLQVTFNYPAQLTYSNIAVNVLVQDILDLIADEGFTSSITLSGSPPTIATITFTKRDTPSSALQAIISQINDGNVNYWVYVTPRQVVTFEPLGATVSSPWNISTLDTSDGNIEIPINNTVTLEKYINAATVEVAAAQAASAISQTIIGGNPPRRSWTVTAPVAAAPTITRYTFLTSLFTGVGSWKGFAQTVGILNDPVSGQGRQWYWQPGSNTITQDPVIGTALGYAAGGVPIPETLVVTYYPQVSVIQSYTNAAEVTARQLVEGGSGRYEGYSNPGSLAALASSANGNYAQALVSSLDSLAQNLKVVTNRPGQFSGMFLTVHLPEIGASAVYVVDNVSLAVRENILTWTITLVLGAVIGDWKVAWRSWGGGEAGLSGLGSPSPGSSGGLIPVTNPDGVLALSFAAGLAQVGVPYNGVISPSGGVTPYVITVDPNTTLPPGLNLDGTMIIGTPLQSGTFSFTLVVTDFSLVAVSRACEIVITPATTPLPSASGITAVTAAIVSRRILADQSTHVTVRSTITWAAGFSGVQNLTGWLFFRRTSGSAAAWFYQGIFQITVGDTLDLDILVVDGASVSAIIALQAGVSPGNGTVPLGGPPVGSVQSGAFALVLAAPSNNHSTATIANIQGTSPTPTNIYRGVNSLGNPYAEVFINLQTAGIADPDIWFYWVWVQWTDAAGTPINPGGVSNNFGWQPGQQFPNDGSTKQQDLLINYPAPGVDGYLTIQVWGLNRNYPLGSQVAPFAANAGATLQACWPGAATFYRLHVGSQQALDKSLTLTKNLFLASATGADGNFCPNPSFEYPFVVGSIVNWNPNAGTISQINTAAGGGFPGPYDGQWYCQIPAAVSAGPSLFFSPQAQLANLQVNSPSFTAGQVLVIESAIAADGTGSNLGDGRIYVDFRDSSGALLGGAYTAPLTRSTSWVKYTHSIIIPAGAYYMYVIPMWVTGSPTSGNWFCDAVKMKLLPLGSTPLGTVLSPSNGGFWEAPVNTGGMPPTTYGNVQTSALLEPSFTNITLGKIPAWMEGRENIYPWRFDFMSANPACGFIGAAEGNSDTKSLRLTSDATVTMEASQFSKVQPGVPYNFSFWAKSSSSALAAHALVMYLIWMDESSNAIRTDTGSIQGSFPAFTNIFMGTFSAPTGLSGGGLPCAKVRVVFRVESTCPINEWFEVDDVYFQSVVNQTSNGQTNTTQPRTTSHGPTGRNVAGAQSTTTSAKSNWGLDVGEIIAAGGEAVYMRVAANSASLTLSSGTPSVNLSAGATDAIVQVEDSATRELIMNPLGFSTVNQSWTPYTGVQKPTGYQGGIGYGPGVADVVRPTIQTNAASGRAYNTVYQNVTGVPLYVSISGSPSSVGLSLIALSDAANPPTLTVAQVGCSVNATLGLFFIVLPGNYYKVLQGASIFAWIEWN